MGWVYIVHAKKKRPSRSVAHNINPARAHSHTHHSHEKDTQSEEDWVRKQSAPNYGIRTLSQIKLGNKVLLIHDTEAIADKILGLEVGAFRPGPF